MTATHLLYSLALTGLLVMTGTAPLAHASDTRRMLPVPTTSRDSSDNKERSVPTAVPPRQSRPVLPHASMPKPGVRRAPPAGKPARPPSAHKPGGFQFGHPGAAKPPGAHHLPSGMATKPGSKVLLSNTPTIALRPKLEVQVLSGDFSQWGTDMVVPHIFEYKKFRWTSSNSGWTPYAILYDIYQTSNCQGTPKATMPVPKGQVNAQGGTFEIGLGSYIYTGNYYMSVCLGFYNSDMKLVGGKSNPVNIQFKKPPSTTQQLQVDSLGILNTNVPAANLDGQSASSPGFDNDNSVAIHYQYHLQSTNAAVVTAELIGENGLLAIGNGFVIDNIHSGTSQGNIRATIKCNATQQTSTVITGVRLVMNDGGNELADTKTVFPAPVTFHCDKAKHLDSLTIQSITPPPGSTISRLNHGNHLLTPDNAITITYQYNLVSQPDGKITQYALTQSGDIHPNNFWIPAGIHSTGSGTDYVRLAVLCKGETTTPKTIHGIQIVLWGSKKYTGTRHKMISHTFPVEYTFTCRDPVVGKIKPPTGNNKPAPKPQKPSPHPSQPSPGGFVGQ